jgi:peptide/nickel transport system permease protein
MFRFVLKRVGLSFVTLGLVAIIVFFMTHILPGDLARQYLGKGATPEAVAQFNIDHGFNRSLISQFISWLSGFARGDLGESLQFGIPVTKMLVPAITKSGQLALVAFVLIIPTSILGGVTAAMKRGKIADRLITVGGLSAAVIPEFVWSVILILLFGVTFRLFPVTAFPDEGETGIFTSVYHLILPSVALLLVLFGYIARITRSGVIEALDSDYMRTAVLKGHSRKRAVISHVLRNALLPTIAVIASQVPYLVGGLVAVEIVFSYPGFGSLLLGAVGSRDFSMLQSAVLLTGLIIIFFQLIADLLFAVLNPRIRQRVTE